MMGGRSRFSLAFLIVVTVAGHLLLAAGLFGPSITIRPRMGEFTSIASVLRILERDETLSIVASIRRLFDSGNVILAVIIAFASVVTPLLKLVVVNKALLDALRGLPITPFLSRMSYLTKYSFVDVLVIAILIVCAKGLPGGTVIEARWGLSCFGIAAALPWLVVYGLSGRARRAAPAPASPPAANL